MAIEEINTLYEVLFRFGDTGQFQGAHSRYLEVVKDTDSGKVYVTREGDAQPLQPAEVAGLMDGALADSAAQLTAVQSDRDALALQLAEVTAERDALKVQATA